MAFPSYRVKLRCCWSTIFSLWARRPNNGLGPEGLATKLRNNGFILGPGLATLFEERFFGLQGHSFVNHAD